MINPMITAIFVVYSILVLVLLISTYFILKKIRRQNRIWRMMINDLATRNKLLTDARDRQREVGQVFSKLLFDLAHSDSPETIQWKLMCIRQVKDVLVHHPGAGYYYDANYHNWLIEMLTRATPQCKQDVLNIIRKWTKGYYVMDPANGENITNLIEKLMNVEETRKGNEQVWLQQLDELTKFVKETGLNFPIVDTKPKDPEPVRKLSFEEILAEINADPNLWGSDLIEEVTSDGSSQPDSGTEEYSERSENISVEELQGQEEQSVCSEDTTESESVPEGSEVIVLSGSKAV